ncbi:MAG: ATP-binding protein [Candidatus Methanomethylophilaceae archaeon]|nr:ATP-binding protein [Candidatus Methanomethylophilaceae archaeon]
MLLDFSLENFGPFRDRTTFSLQATKRGEHQENVIPCGTLKSGILSSVSVFGPNASGKSYLFQAFRALSSIVSDAFVEGFRYPWYHPFKLDDTHAHGPISLGIRFIEEDIVYEYAVSFVKDHVVSESLVYRPMGRPRMVFRRCDGNETFSPKQKKMKAFLTPASTFLVIGAKYNDEVCAKVRNMILGLIILESEDISHMAELSYAWASDDPSRKKAIIEGLRKADLGIVDFDSTEHVLDRESIRSEIPPTLFDRIPSDEDGKLKFGSIRLVHGFCDHGNETRRIPFEIELESTGTVCMFGMMGPLMDALMNGRTLIIDEFGSHLHPILTRWLVSQFSSENNPNRAQLVVMTHDVGLMDTDELLRRDQIYFTDKDRRDGSSTLYCLSDFRGVRKDEIVLKSYLLGRYDAVPEVTFRGLMDGQRHR